MTMNTRQRQAIKPAKKDRWKKITIILAPDSKMPTIAGKWKRLESGRIKAWYSLEEYARCLSLFEMRKDLDHENES